jgi:hypothetical protein
MWIGLLQWMRMGWIQQWSAAMLRLVSSSDKIQARSRFTHLFQIGKKINVYKFHIQV